MLETLVLVAGLLGTGDTLSGRVAGPDGDPVAGATGTVVELHRVALTRADGAYRFADLPPGHYTITVRGLGFAPVARDVVVRGATTLSVTLTRTAIWVEPVTVTATRAPLAAGLSPLPTEALSEDNLRREQSVSLAHALANLPGVEALTTGQQIGKPVIRGLTGPRVLVLEDGSRLEDYSWSDEDGPSVDARLAQRVEVIRGPASVLYGSDALGGVVNGIPEDLPDANGGPRALRSGFEISGASNNAELEGAARLEGASGGWGWRLFGIGRFASSLHTPAGELDNTGFNALSGEAAVGRRGARGSTTLRYTRYGGEFKLLEAEGPATGEAGGPERKLSEDRVQFAGDYLVAGVRLETKAQWQRHSLIEVSDTGVSPGGQPLEGTAFDLLLTTFTIDALAHHTAGTRVAGTLGVSGVAQSNDTRGRVPLVPDARVRSGAVFGFEQASLGRVRVLAGARLDARRAGGISQRGRSLHFHHAHGLLRDGFDVAPGLAARVPLPAGGCPAAGRRSRAGGGGRGRALGARPRRRRARHQPGDAGAAAPDAAGAPGAGRRAAPHRDGLGGPRLRRRRSRGGHATDPPQSARRPDRRVLTT